ncbi:MAG: ribonuclease HI [candidate division KSB1 bacterium]|nr:ribonuclease HI [candidate division KSB1 bacterium]MDZ7346154.1 ribonuclease HI [candidate division KSB1 bacterium]
MSSSKKIFYAVARGRRTGLFTSWGGENGAEEQVRGFPGAVFKGFARLEDALDYLHAHGVTAEGFADHRPRDRHADGAVHFYTDGASIGNPGRGGFAVIRIRNGDRSEWAQGFRLTTNNRMELLACISALESLSEPLPVVIHCDSRYVIDNLQQGRVRRWRENGWRTAAGKPVENADLWQRLLELTERFSPTFDWVKGHAGSPENERCDRLAQAAAAADDVAIDEGYERRD